MTAIVSLPSPPLVDEPPRHDAAARRRIEMDKNRFIEVSVMTRN
jgi:hypothetical protein